MNLNATANPPQRLYQPHSAPNIGRSASSSSSVPAVNPTNASPEITQEYTVPFVAKSNAVKTFDERDYHNTSEEYLHQSNSDTIFTMREKPLDLVVFNRRQLKISVYTVFFL